MRLSLRILPLLVFAFTGVLLAQTAEELIAKNIQAKGGSEKIKAIHSLRKSGKMQSGSFSIDVVEESLVPDRLRQSVSLQGMTQVMAYDGSGTTAWQLNPFGGRRDPELLGEDEQRGLVEAADFYGPLIDYEKKGNTIAYLGHELVDGDDTYRLRVTLKNGDIIYYYLDPDTYLEIKTETIQHIRGAVREFLSEFGSYKKVDGVYFPFSVASGSKESSDRAQLTYDKIEANVPIAESGFKFPTKAK